MQAFVSFFIAVFVSLAPAPATAADDVGLVNQLQGEVGYRPAGGAAGRASAFMKVRDGDSFRLPAGARVRVVYFDGGRQETWDGPAEFTARRKEGAAASGRPAVTQLPGNVPQALAQTPELMQIVKLGRPGAVTVRGLKPGPTPEQQAALQAAREHYKAMAASAPADDITPELYLITVLQQHAQHDEIRQTAARMQAKQPLLQEVRDIVTWANGLGAR